MPNCIEAITTYYALRKVGAIAVPLSLDEAPARLNFIVDNCTPNLIVEQDGSLTRLAVQSRARRINVPSQLATIIYTSGTTGVPKGVCLAIRNWDQNAFSLIRHHHLTQSSRIASALPLFHCNAHGFAMHATLLAGCTLVLCDRTGQDFLDILNEEKVEVASLVPAILQSLVRDRPGWVAHDDFCYFLTAAAPFTADLWSLVRTQWRGTRVIQGYGLTESTNFSCTVPVDLDDPLYELVMGSHPTVGVALSGVEILVEGSEAEGDSGELLISGVSNALGYWGDPLTGMSVVRTGDLGYFRILGNRKFYYLSGRLKELINRGGEKLYPLEIEKELRSAGVPEIFHVFQIMDERLGEEVALAVLAAFDFDLLQALPVRRRPKLVLCVRNFPTTPTGKIQRRTLSRLAELAEKGDEIDSDASVIWRFKSE